MIYGKTSYYAPFRTFLKSSCHEEDTKYLKNALNDIYLQCENRIY